MSNGILSCHLAEGFNYKERGKPKYSSYEPKSTKPSEIFSVTFTMPFVQIPKDLSKIRTKIAFGLGKRQLICFGSGAVIGLPAYFFTRNIIGNTFALVLMIIMMSPLFLLGIYEKDGQPAEKVVINFLRLKLYYKGIRLYKTENFYETVEMIAQTDKNNNMGGGYVGAKKSKNNTEKSGKSKKSGKSGKSKAATK